jgi:hypothetical protein
MLKSRRRVAIALTAAASAASMLLLAAPAEALVIPTWPTTAYAPTGCATATTSGSLSNWSYAFTDTGAPKFTKLNLGTGTSATSVLPPAGASVKITATVSETCTGAQIVWVYPRLGTGDLLGLGVMAPTTTNVFNGPWSVDLQQAVTGTPGVTKPDAAGAYTVPAAFGLRRYDSLALDKNLAYVSSVTTAFPVTGLDTIFGPFVTQKFYLLRATTLTNTLSATKVTKGKTVKATAVFKYATNAGYVGNGSAKVKVLTKVGTGAWVTNATLTTNSAGVVTYSFVVSKATSVRFVAASVLSGKFTNGAASAIRTVTIG